jgi:hypothetical protein
MKLHANHRTCPSSRRLMCERVLVQGWTLARAAEAAGCSERTAAKWVKHLGFTEFRHAGEGCELRVVPAARCASRASRSSS